MGGSPRQALEPDTPQASFPAARPSQPDADPGRLRALWAQPAVRTLAAAHRGPERAARGGAGAGRRWRGTKAGRRLPDITNPGHLGPARNKGMRSHGEGETKPQGLPRSRITEVDVHAAGGLTPGGTETVAGAD